MVKKTLEIFRHKLLLVSTTQKLTASTGMHFFWKTAIKKIVVKCNPGLQDYYVNSNALTDLVSLVFPPQTSLWFVKQTSLWFVKQSHLIIH